MQPKQTSPPVQEEEEYVVEKIVDHRRNKKGKLEYFIKWKGFSDAENTWEPLSHLNCESLVEEYEVERKKAEKAEKADKADKADKAQEVNATTTTTTTTVSEEKPKQPEAKKSSPKKKTSEEKVLEEKSIKVSKVTKETKRKASEDVIDTKKKKPDEDAEIKVYIENGFDQGWVAEEILGATETYGELYFLIKWRERKDATLIAARVVNLKIPQMVIAFYEARTTWDTKGQK